MYSIIGVLKKPDSWTTEQFRKWWLTEHPSAIRLCMRFNIALGKRSHYRCRAALDGPWR